MKLKRIVTNSKQRKEIEKINKDDIEEYRKNILVDQ